MKLQDFLPPNAPLVIADLANNHSGDLNLAKSMILELSKLQKKHQIKIVVKFQYRDLDTYIDSKFKGNKDHKFVSRFESTRIEWEDFQFLTKFSHENGLLTAATPFDEVSAIKVNEHGHNILKVASACSNDWNLLEKCILQDKPMVVSVGGLDTFEIDKVVSFLKHRHADFALMHCVAIYPTENQNLNLSRINFLKTKYKVVTGYSTHENPSNYLAGSLALAAGAQILERHFAIEKQGIKINSYSSTVNEFDIWLNSLKSSLEQIYDSDFEESIRKQKFTLHELQRGLYALTDIEANKVIDSTNTYAAIPAKNEQLTSNNLSINLNIISSKKIFKGNAIYKQDTKILKIDESIEKILENTRNLINLAGITLGPDVDLEISHHFGLEKFSSFGAVLIPIINREYAKKLVVMTKNQSHPEHFHKIKEETFIILTGKLKVQLDNRVSIMEPGDVLLIPRSAKHSMFAIEDTIFEEISSTSIVGDSYYTNSLDLNKVRKTLISLWF